MPATDPIRGGPRQRGTAGLASPGIICPHVPTRFPHPSDTREHRQRHPHRRRHRMRAPSDRAARFRPVGRQVAQGRAGLSRPGLASPSIRISLLPSTSGPEQEFSRSRRELIGCTRRSTITVGTCCCSARNRLACPPKYSMIRGSPHASEFPCWKAGDRSTCRTPRRSPPTRPGGSMVFAHRRAASWPRMRRPAVTADVRMLVTGAGAT